MRRVSPAARPRLSAVAACCALALAAAAAQTQPGACAVCAAGLFCPGAKYATPCPPNSVSPPGATSAAQCVCIAGFWRRNATHSFCAQCGEGFYCPGDELAHPCPRAHQTSPPGATSAHACHCVESYYGPPGRDCQLCPPGAYCPLNSTAPVPCPSNSSVHAHGSWRETDCKCDAGHVRSAGSRHHGPGLVETGAGFNAPLPDNSSSHGTRSPGPLCDPCPVDTYCPMYNVTMRCPHNTSTRARTGAVSARECVADPGFYIASGTGPVAGPPGPALPCPAGAFCTGGLGAPETCPANSSAPAGARTLSDCKCDRGLFNEVDGHGGVVCSTAAPAYYSPEGDDALYPCPAHSSVQGGGGGGSVAECACNAGYYALALGEDCEPCPTGFFCAPGAAPQRCPADALWSDAGAAGPGACTSARPPGPAGIPAALCSAPHSAADILATNTTTGSCLWECSRGFHFQPALASAGRQPNQTAGVLGRCTPCAQALTCAAGFRPSGCPPGAMRDSQCVACGLPPRHSHVVPAPGGELCGYACDAGHWKPDRLYVDLCCSAYAFFVDRRDGLPAKCVCLPGWVGDGVDCVL